MEEDGSPARRFNPPGGGGMEARVDSAERAPGSGNFKSVTIQGVNDRQETKIMWEMVVEAARSPALHWGVLAGGGLAFVVKVFTAPAVLMGDVYSDDLDA